MTMRRHCSRQGGFGRGYAPGPGPGSRGPFRGNQGGVSPGGRNRQGLYRSRSGMVMGVCKGLAEYFGFSVTWIRIIAVLLLLFTGLWPVVVLYVLAGLLMKPEPAVPFASDADREFYESYAGSRSMALGRLKRKFEHLDRRIRRMEDVVTSRDYEWERRMSGNS